MKPVSFKKILILVTILAVPGFLYYLLQEKGKNRYKPLPYFGPKVTAQTFHSVMGKKVRDTIYHEVKDLSGINQHGDSVNWDAYKGKVVVFGLFYSKAKTKGVEFAMKAMRAFDVTYASNERVHFVSLSMDPEEDTPAVLSKYADHFHAKAGKWDLVTGDSTQIFGFINKQLQVDAHRIPGMGQGTSVSYTYSNLFVLVDPQHHIRGYYEATNQEALSKLDDEIKVLIAEILRNTEDGR